MKRRGSPLGSGMTCNDLHQSRKTQKLKFCTLIMTFSCSVLLNLFNSWHEGAPLFDLLSQPKFYTVTQLQCLLIISLVLSVSFLNFMSWPLQDLACHLRSSLVIFVLCVTSYHLFQFQFFITFSLAYFCSRFVLVTFVHNFSARL